MSKIIKMLLVLFCANIGLINAQNLTYSQKEFAKSGELDCFTDEKCPQIVLKIDWFEPNNAGSKINEKIFETVLYSSYINFFATHPNYYERYYHFGEQGYARFASAFVSDFSQQKELDERSNAPYYKTSVDVSAEVTYNEKRTLNVVVEYKNTLADWVRDDYNKVSLLFDPQTGEQLNFYKDILRNKNAFTKVAIERLKHYGVEDEDFDEDFKLPNNVIITSDKVIIFYERSPIPDDGTYASFELDIPLAEVKQFLNL